MVAKTMLNQTMSRPILYAYAQEQIAKTPSQWLTEKNEKIQEFLACIPQIKEVVKNKIGNLYPKEELAVLKKYELTNQESCFWFTDREEDTENNRSNRERSIYANFDCKGYGNSYHYGSSKKENTKWTTDYNKWLEDNQHMPDDWKNRNKTAEEMLSNPRPKSDPPKPPMGVQLKDATDEQIEKWGKELGKWQEENNHLPNLQPIDNILNNVKARRDQMSGQAPQAAAGGGSSLTADQNARITRLEQKLDKLIKHLGVK